MMTGHAHGWRRTRAGWWAACRTQGPSVPRWNPPAAPNAAQMKSCAHRHPGVQRPCVGRRPPDPGWACTRQAHRPEERPWLLLVHGSRHHPVRGHTPRSTGAATAHRAGRLMCAASPRRLVRCVARRRQKASEGNDCCSTATPATSGALVSRLRRCSQHSVQSIKSSMA